MARKPRIHYPGALYHVTLRGNNRQDIFYRDSDRPLWESILTTALARYKASVHAYCWMDNHMHLIARVAKEPLASTIRYAASQYSRKINLREQRTGHLFERRHGAYLVEDDSHFKGLIRYIHNNPIRAGMVETMDQYRWSSHLAYAGHLENSWLQTEFVLGMFGETKRIARRHYLAFIRTEVDEDLSIYRHADNDADDDVPNQAETTDNPAAPAPSPPPQTLESIIQRHLRRSGLTDTLLIGPSKARYISKVRTEIIMDALQQGIANIADLSRRLNRSESAISQAVTAKRKALKK